ncbi:hypothetical protein [Salsuginibacillus kocurii]|uniref:hypothetical protein n=1 Tax=Salsuginibacillus kocurii TaxID=427078 RepID=UPI0003707670|nr:hypothetical protein [Salsuginibacillus kocurii]
MITFQSFSGIITRISDFMKSQNDKDGCYKLISVVDGSGTLVNFVVSPTTYFVDDEMVSTGDQVSGYYDRNAPVPLIYPPQYRALIMVKDSPYQHAKVDRFNEQLVSSDGLLQLNLSPDTLVILRNGQPFTKSLTNRNLVVLYRAATKSIPAQTTPDKLIVWC